jgi:hypothetical protein
MNRCAPELRKGARMHGADGFGLLPMQEAIGERCPPTLLALLAPPLHEPSPAQAARLP